VTPERVEIRVEPASFDRAGAGAITGPIWLHHGRRDAPGADFPEPRWSDFPVVVLAWWLEALAAQEGGAETTFRFMDGPFELRVAPAEPSLVRVRCFGHGIDAKAAGADFRAAAAAFYAAVRSAAAAALAECDRRSWAGPDVEALRRALVADRSRA
jgi:hypothetical protein